MRISTIDITEIRLINFDSKTKRLVLEFSFLNDSMIKREYKYELIDMLPEMILRDIKQLKTPNYIDDEDEILGSINMALIKNDEEIKLALSRSLLKLGDRLVNLKYTTDATDYMKAYKSINTHQEIIYKNNGR